MAVMNAIYSKNSDEWNTPEDLFEELDKEFHLSNGILDRNLIIIDNLVRRKKDKC